MKQDTQEVITNKEHITMLIAISNALMDPEADFEIARRCFLHCLEGFMPLGMWLVNKHDPKVRHGIETQFCRITTMAVSPYITNCGNCSQIHMCHTKLIPQLLDLSEMLLCDGCAQQICAWLTIYNESVMLYWFFRNCPNGNREGAIRKYCSDVTNLCTYRKCTVPLLETAC